MTTNPMEMIGGHISALTTLLLKPETGAPLHWLFRRPSLMQRRFDRLATITHTRNGHFEEIRVNGQIFLWPVDVSHTPLLQVVAEQEPAHPHRYDWGNTRIASGDIVIDIGACEGCFSAYAASLGARVVAVEPSTTMVRIIERLFQLRGLPDPIIVNALVGKSNGEFHFLENAENIAASQIVSGPLPGSYPIRSTTLDDLVASLALPRVDFIKCDAEGADVEIIQSAEATLKRYKPRIAVTTYHSQDHYRILHAYLSNLGYRVEGKGYLYSNGKYVVVMLHAD